MTERYLKKDRSRCEYRVCLETVWLQMSCLVTLYLNFCVYEKQLCLDLGVVMRTKWERVGWVTQCSTGIPFLYPFPLHLDSTLYLIKAWLVFRNLSASPQAWSSLASCWVPAQDSAEHPPQQSSVLTLFCSAHLYPSYSSRTSKSQGPNMDKSFFWMWSRNPAACSD